MKWPSELSSAGVACGIKARGDLDLGLLVVARPVTWAGAFTRNAAAAAPVWWCRDRRGSPARAIVVNSGNANACTGEDGIRAVETTAHRAAAEIGCRPDEVLVASTGPIGVPLPTGKIMDALPRAARSLTDDVSAFSHAILTTDTTTKTATARAGAASVIGVAKGAAMVAPNMATMLAFLATDASLDGDALQETLGIAVDHSFNRISIDDCMSTNDSVFLLATGSVQAEREQFQLAVDEVCSDLGRQIVADAEGGTKLMRVIVQGAHDARRADALARAVGSSALWRAAAYGNDPNWGRIVAALGAADADLDPGRLEILIGSTTVFPHDRAATPGRAAAEMSADAFDVTCIVGDGPVGSELLTCDLTPAYVELNASGTT